MALYDEFIIRYPEFLDPPVSDPPTPPVTPEQIQYWLDWAAEFLCPNAWGNAYKDAVMALAGVMLSDWVKSQMNGPGSASASGPVTSASVGGESVGYGFYNRNAVRYTDEWFLLHQPYGGFYLFLRDSSISGMTHTRTGFYEDFIFRSGC